MKLQQSVASCNLNIPPIVKKLELCHQQNNKRSSFIEVPMLDSSRKARDTKLIAGNILVFGGSPKFNQRISRILKKAFRENYYDALIIDVDQFLAMSDEARQNSDVLYIIVCSDLHINPKKLTILKNQVSNTIICKLPGLETKGSNLGIHFPTQVKNITSALGIDEENAVALGLLASLKNSEFCVGNGEMFTKRVF